MTALETETRTFPAVAGGAPPQPARHHTRLPLARHVAWVVVTALSAAVLGFVVYVGLLSSVYHARAQRTAYADFRAELANATAPVTPTGPGTAVAVLDIPEIQVREVVFEGTAGSVLQKGPGHLRSSVLPGQIGVSVVMGRAAAYGGPLERLGELDPGDTLTVTTGQGELSFRVLGVRRVGDPQPPVELGRARLVLATADGPPFLPSGVLRVDADLVSPVQATAAPVFGADNLPAAEQPLARDPSAWVLLGFWGQALLVAAIAVTWAYRRWGPWQTWIVGVPMLGFLGIAVADQATRLLPNLL